MTTAADTVAAGDLGPLTTGDGTPLKTALARATRRARLKALTIRSPFDSTVLHATLLSARMSPAEQSSKVADARARQIR